MLILASRYIVSAYKLDDGRSPPGIAARRNKDALQLPNAKASWFTADTDSVDTSSFELSLPRNAENVKKEASGRFLCKFSKF